MPLQNDRFPSKHLQDGLALWFSFFPSKMQLKILYCSKLFGFLTPITWFLPKNTHTENNMITCEFVSSWFWVLRRKNCSKPFCHWPFQEPKLEVPTIYKAYVREYPHKIWPYMVQYLHFRILKFPLILWFYSLQSWFLVHFGFATKWVSWNWSHKSVLDSLDCSGPIRAHFLSTNWVHIGS